MTIQFAVVMPERVLGGKHIDIAYEQAEAAFFGFTNRLDAHTRLGAKTRGKNSTTVRSRYSEEQKPLVVTVNACLISLFRGTDFKTGEPVATYQDRVVESFRPNKSFHSALNSAFLATVEEFYKRHENLMPVLSAVMVNNGSIGVNTVFSRSRYFLEKALKGEQIKFDDLTFYVSTGIEGVENQCSGEGVAMRLFYGAQEAAEKLSQIPQVRWRYKPFFEVSEGDGGFGLDAHILQFAKKARMKNLAVQPEI